MDFFQVFFLIGNQVNKLELSKIHDIFHVSLLEYNIKKKVQADETISQLDFRINDNKKKYKLKKIWNNAIYTR